MTKLKSEWIHVSKNCHGGKYKIHLKQSETGKWKHCFEYVDGTWTDWIPCYGPSAMQIEWVKY
jgi:hypothetical protein